MQYAERAAGGGERAAGGATNAVAFGEVVQCSVGWRRSLVEGRSGVLIFDPAWVAQGGCAGVFFAWITWRLITEEITQTAN